MDISPNITDYEIKKIFINIDVNDDKSIEYDEFLAIF